MTLDIDVAIGWIELLKLFDHPIPNPPVSFSGNVQNSAVILPLQTYQMKLKINMYSYEVLWTTPITIMLSQDNDSGRD